MAEGAEEWGPSVGDLKKDLSVPLGEGLMGSQIAQVRLLEWKFPDVFSASPGLTDLASHLIETIEGKVVCLPLWRRPYRLERILREEVDEMLCLGVIEPSHSPWRSHPVMVPKPDGSVRVCIDFRKVNEVSHLDAYPLPIAPGLLEWLGQEGILADPPDCTLLG